MAVVRSGSSRSSSAYVLPPVAASAWWAMTSAWTKASSGPVTLAPANIGASADTVMFSVASFALTIPHVAAPPMMKSAPMMRVTKPSRRTFL